MVKIYYSKKIIFSFLFIVCLLFVLHYNLSKNDIYFLNKSKSKNIISNKNYFEKFNKIDKKARNLSYNINEIQAFYSNNIISFSFIEKKSIIWLIKNLRKRLNYPKITQEWSFIKVNNTIENGYPHTRKNTIILSSNSIKNLVNSYYTNDLRNGLLTYGSLFIHEKIHVMQRQYPSIFDDLYLNYWKFTKASKIYNSKKYINKNRTNPDGMSLNWIFNNNIWLMCLYNSESMSNVNYVGIYLNLLDEQKLIYEVPKNPKIVELLKIPEFRNFFISVNHNHYHPNELSAEIFSIYYLDKLNLDSYNQNDLSIVYFDKWFKKNKNFFV